MWSYMWFRSTKRIYITHRIREMMCFFRPSQVSATCPFLVWKKSKRSILSPSLTFFLYSPLLYWITTHRTQTRIIVLHPNLLPHTASQLSSCLSPNLVGPPLANIPVASGSRGATRWSLWCNKGWGIGICKWRSLVLWSSAARCIKGRPTVLQKSPPVL